MPELPEVETARRAILKVARGKRIAAVECAADSIVFDDQTPAEVVVALTGRRIVGSGRHGKHFWLELDQRPWPLIHFGMTGWMEPVTELPRFQKLLITLDDGTRIAFCDARRLGRVRLRNEPRNEDPVSRLGFDVFDALPPKSDFVAAIRLRKAPVKAVLLDQGFTAGVGNWIADEILYQAKVRPQRRANRLSVAEAGAIWKSLRHIVPFAVKHGSDDAKFPKTWLFHYRWGKGRAAKDGRGNPIRFHTVGGRTTAWVPAVQR